MSGELSIITEFKPFELAASDSSAMLQRFVSSEGVYVTEVLGKLVELQRISTEQKLLNAQEIEGIFRNVKDLYEIHYQFYREMGRDIAQAIKTYTPFFKMYGIYMTSHEQAMNLLKEKFFKAKKFTEMLNSSRTKVAVDVLFELPIVRLNQYADYATILSGALVAKNNSSVDVRTALDKMNVVLQEIIENEFNRLARQDVYVLQAEVFKDKIDIMSPSRFVIKKGLILFSEDGKKFKDGALILFNDFILVSTAKFKPKVIFRIRNSNCSSQSSFKKYSYIFSVQYEVGITYFCASSEEERVEWISTISQASEQEATKPGSNLTHAAFSRIILKTATQEDVSLQNRNFQRIAVAPASPKHASAAYGNTIEDDQDDEEQFTANNEQYNQARITFASPLGATSRFPQNLKPIPAPPIPPIISPNRDRKGSPSYSEVAGKNVSKQPPPISRAGQMSSPVIRKVASPSESLMHSPPIIPNTSQSTNNMRRPPPPIPSSSNSYHQPSASAYSRRDSDETSSTHANYGYAPPQKIPNPSAAVHRNPPPPPFAVPQTLSKSRKESDERDKDSSSYSTSPQNFTSPPSSRRFGAPPPPLASRAMPSNFASNSRKESNDWDENSEPAPTALRSPPPLASRLPPPKVNVSPALSNRKGSNDWDDESGNTTSLKAPPPSWNAPPPPPTRSLSPSAPKARPGSNFPAPVSSTNRKGSNDWDDDSENDSSMKSPPPSRNAPPLPPARSMPPSAPTTRPGSNFPAPISSTETFKNSAANARKNSNEWDDDADSGYKPASMAKQLNAPHAVSQTSTMPRANFSRHAASPAPSQPNVIKSRKDSNECESGSSSSSSNPQKFRSPISNASAPTRNSLNPPPTIVKLPSPNLSRAPNANIASSRTSAISSPPAMTSRNNSGISNGSPMGSTAPSSRAAPPLPPAARQMPTASVREPLNRNLQPVNLLASASPPTVPSRNASAPSVANNGRRPLPAPPVEVEETSPSPHRAAPPPAPSIPLGRAPPQSSPIGNGSGAAAAPPPPPARRAAAIPPPAPSSIGRAPPSSPSIGNSGTSAPPPLPPRRAAAIPPPAPSSSGRAPPPSPPMGMGGAPPPPPPAPRAAAPPPPAPAVSSRPPHSSGGREHLLSDIRSGAKLKKVKTNDRSKPNFSIK